MSRGTLRAAAGGIAVLVVSCVVLAAQADATTSANLIKNGGAEAAAGSTGGIVAVPHWTVTAGTGFTAVKYGSAGFPSASTPGPTSRGKNFFSGGPTTDSVVASQTVSLSAFVSAINTGKARYQASAWLGGKGAENDQAFVEMDFKNASGALVGTSITLGPVNATNRGNVTKFLSRARSGAIPKAARSVLVQLSLEYTTGNYNDAYADDLVFRVVH